MSPRPSQGADAVLVLLNRPYPRCHARRLSRCVLPADNLQFATALMNSRKCLCGCNVGIVMFKSKDNAVDNVLVELSSPWSSTTLRMYYDTVQADIVNNTNKPDTATNSKVIEYMKKLTLTVSAADESRIMAMKVSDVYLRYCRFQTARQRLEAVD
jgi:hypothetical protein